MPSLPLNLPDDDTRFTNSQLLQLRRQMLRYARSWPRGSSERNQRRQTAASLRSLFANEEWLDAHFSFGTPIAIKATCFEIRTMSKILRRPLLTDEGTALPRRALTHWRWRMPHYFFDIEDGHRLVDPSGSNFKDDSAAIEKARVLAIGVSLDKPAVDPTWRIAVLNADRDEISTVPVYSKPA